MTVWLPKQLQTPPPNNFTQTSKLFTYLRCAICAAVALGGPPICDPTEKTSSSDIAPSFVSCWSAARFAIVAGGKVLAEGGQASGPILLKPRGITSEQLWCSQCFLKRDKRGYKGREVEERGERSRIRSGRSVIEASPLFFLHSPFPEFPLVTRAFEVLYEDVQDADGLETHTRQPPHNKLS